MVLIFGLSLGVSVIVGFGVPLLLAAFGSVGVGLAIPEMPVL